MLAYSDEISDVADFQVAYTLRAIDCVMSWTTLYALGLSSVIDNQ